MVTELRDVMLIAASRLLADVSVCFVGIGLPSIAAVHAQRSHNPDLKIVYESGIVGARPSAIPQSIGDGSLVMGASAIVSMPEIFNTWLQGGRVDVGLIGAAQIDRQGNINTTVIGTYDDPTVRLPGAGGAPQIAAMAHRTIVMLDHERRSLPAEVAFITTPGCEGTSAERARRGLHGLGPTTVVTDRCVMEYDQTRGEYAVMSLFPGVGFGEVQQLTDWPIQVADGWSELAPPSHDELTLLRALQPNSGR